MSKNKETIGERIKKRREELRISQEELAHRTGLGLRIILLVEADRPAGDFLEPIAEVLGVPLDYLKNGPDEIQDRLKEFVKTILRTRFRSSVIVQECLDEFAPSVKFRGQNLSDTEFEVLRERLYEYLDSRALEDEIRVFGLNV